MIFTFDSTPNFYIFFNLEELRLHLEQSNEVETEVEVLRAQIRQLQADLEEAHSAVTIAQCTAENDIAVEKRKCQEEIATVQQLMKGKCCILATAKC